MASSSLSQQLVTQLQGRRWLRRLQTCCVLPQGLLLHFGKAAWSQAKEGSGVGNAFLNPELFLVKGNAAGREGTKRQRGSST